MTKDRRNASLSLSIALLVTLVALLVTLVTAAPPPIHNLSTTFSSRIAVYDDINSQFRLVYAVSSSCPQTVALGEPTIDQRKVAVLPLSSINEDGTLCTGPSPINFIGEENIRRSDDLLTKLQLEGMRQALDNNPNAEQLITPDNPASLLVGWHKGQRTCNAKVYPQDTIYFIINEDNGKTVSLKKPTQRDQLTIPPFLRALLIVAPNSNICLLVDPSSNANDGVTLTIVPDNGSPATTSALTPAGSVPQPATPPAPTTTVPAPVSPPVQSTAAPAVPPTVAGVPPSVASPVPSPVVSVAPGSEGSPGVSPVAGGVVISTPTASPVVPVSGAPSSTPVGVSAAVPDESAGPGIIEVVPSGEDELDLGNTTPPEMDDGSACFPGSATVVTEQDGVKRMSELLIGDRVLTEKGFSDVILFTHRETKSRNTFVRIVVEDGHYLHVSGGHYVFTQNKQLKAAHLLSKGDVLFRGNGAESVIIGIERVSGIGLFNPQTISGSIIVDGLLASTYTTAVDPAIAHSVLMVPVRWMYQVWPRLTEVLSVAFNHGSPLSTAVLPSGAALIG